MCGGVGVPSLVPLLGLYNNGQGNSGLAVDIIPPLLPNEALADQPRNSIGGKSCSHTKGGLYLIYVTFTRITNNWGCK